MSDRPGRPLSPRARRLRRDLLAANTFERHELEILDRALEWGDIGDAMTAKIEAAGLLDATGRPHPLLGPRRDALQTAARFWRQLKFADPAKPARRPGRPSGEAWSVHRAEAARLGRLPGA